MRGLTDEERAMMLESRGCLPCAAHSHLGGRRPLRAAATAALLRRGLLVGEDCRVTPRSWHFWTTPLGTMAVALDTAARGGTAP